MKQILLSALALIGCTQTEPTLMVDQCALEEYRQECEVTAGSELGTPDELEACLAKAKREAVRIRAGVPAQCRGGA